MTVPSGLDPWGQGVYALSRVVPAPTTVDADGGNNGAATVDDGAPWRFDSVEQFVNTYLAQIVCRRLGQGTATWCPEWWRHPEAVVRFDSLWRAFEYCATDTQTGISTWWIHHADPHLRAILDPDYGPFALCDPEDGHSRHPLSPLPVRFAPQEIWGNPLFRVTDGDFDTRGG